VALAGYPPADHVLGDLGIEAEITAGPEARIRTRVTPHIVGADGGVRAGVLATLVDIVGGVVAMPAVHPDWMATADLSLHLAQPARGPYVEARGGVVRKGRTTLVIEAGIYSVDENGTEGNDEDRSGPVGWSTMTFAVLPGRASDLAIDLTSGPAADLPRRWAFTGTGFDRSIDRMLEITVVDAEHGVCALPVRDYVFNSFGAVQGGVMAVLGDVAGVVDMEAMGDGGAPMAVTDLQVTYLALGRSGPITSRASDLRMSSDGSRRGVTVELIDSGADDRVTTIVAVGGVPAMIGSEGKRP
jgi:uncharacterized protein (TIGR00369 family)